MTARDLDVKIAPKGAGFGVAWTTVTYPGGGASSAKVRRKSSAIDFLPSGKPGVFKAARAGDPLAGEAYAWARIKGQTLTVYVLNIDETGAYVVQSYDRTLTGFAMEITFTRIRDNEPERTAKGKLIKIADSKVKLGKGQVRDRKRSYDTGEPMTGLACCPSGAGHRHPSAWLSSLRCGRAVALASEPLPRRATWFYS